MIAEITHVCRRGMNLVHIHKKLNSLHMSKVPNITICVWHTRAIPGNIIDYNPYI